MAEAWRVREVDETRAAAPAAGLGTRGLTARILVGRGYGTIERAGRFGPSTRRIASAPGHG